MISNSIKDYYELLNSSLLVNKQKHYIALNQSLFELNSIDFNTIHDNYCYSKNKSILDS